jgi:hypothetical protein
MTLYVVCDVSGSMGEDGRPFLMRTVVMAIAQSIQLGYGRARIQLCRWAAEAAMVPDWDARQDYPADLLACKGTSNANALVQLFGEKPDGKILVLSDGFWSRDEAKVFKQWKDCLPLDTLRIIKTGSDTSPQLKGMDVFATEDLFAALDGWLEGGPA